MMSEKSQDSQAASISNREVQDRWAIDVNVDPMNIPLEQLDPCHPALFEADKFKPYFDRLRAEDPVHLTTESMFGPY